MTDHKKDQPPKITLFELLLVSFLLVTAVLSSVAFLRLAYGKPVFPAGESYYSLRMAEALKENPFLTQDPLQERPHYQNPYHYFIAGFLKIMPPDTASLILPIFLGLVSAFLFFRLLTLFGMDERKAFFSLVLLSLTPAFIILFTGMSILSFSIFLSLLSLVLLFDRKKSSLQKDTELFVGAILLLILGITNMAAFIITMLIFLVLSILMKKKIKMFLIISLAAALMLVLLTQFSVYQIESVRSAGFHAFDVKSVFSVFGAPIGFDIFFMIIFFTGFIIIWRDEPKKRIFHLMALLFVLFSFFNTVARAYADFIIITYCVAAIIYMYTRHWELQIVRTGTLLLVLCSILFSCLNQVTILVNAEPGREMRDALLSFRGLDSGTVLSDTHYGFIIEFYSGQKAFTDANSFLFDDYASLKQAEAELFNCSRLKEAEPLLNSTGIKYIIITPSIKEALWENREEKLLFLVRHSESFDKKYDEAGIEVWQYIPSDYS